VIKQGNTPSDDTTGTIVLVDTDTGVKPAYSIPHANSAKLSTAKTETCIIPVTTSDYPNNKKGM